MASWMVLDNPGWNFWRPKGSYLEPHFGKLWSINYFDNETRKVTLQSTGLVISLWSFKKVNTYLTPVHKEWGPRSNYDDWERCRGVINLGGLLGTGTQGQALIIIKMTGTRLPCTRLMTIVFVFVFFNTTCICKVPLCESMWFTYSGLWPTAKNPEILRLISSGSYS